MTDILKAVQKLAHQCAAGELTVEQIAMKLDVISANGVIQRQRCAKAFKQCGMYVGIEKMEAETEQLIQRDLDHTVNDEHDDEIRNF